MGGFERFESRRAVAAGRLACLAVGGRRLGVAVGLPAGRRVRLRVEGGAAGLTTRPMVDAIHSSRGAWREWIDHEVELPTSGDRIFGISILVGAVRSSIAGTIDRLLRRLPRVAGLVLAEPIVLASPDERSRFPSPNVVLVSAARTAREKLAARRGASRVARSRPWCLRPGLAVVPEGERGAFRELALPVVGSWGGDAARRRLDGWLRRFGTRGPWLLYLERIELVDPVRSYLEREGLTAQTVVVSAGQLERIDSMSDLVACDFGSPTMATSIPSSR